MSLCSGSGVAGLTTALTASLSGLDAIIVEHRLDIGGTSARSSGRHERAKRFRVEDDVGDLAGLRRNEPAPNRVASRPRIFTHIVKTLRVPVHDDAEDHAVKARDDAAVELRRAGVNRDGVALSRIADGLDPALQEQL